MSISEDFKAECLALECIPRGWDSYDATAPGKRSVREAFYFIRELEKKNFRPLRVAPHVDGGVAVLLAPGVSIWFYDEEEGL